MKRPLSGIITLVTDFGLRDSYVGTMKGVILKICRDATIVDVAHEVKPQDLLEASFVLESCYRFFPDGTIHIVVVDPGVGGTRRPILVESGAHLFIGPDNGVFSRIYAADACTVRHLTGERFRLPHISDTFHGRDIFAPAAAHLLNGAAPSEMGPIVHDPFRQDPPRPVVWKDQLTAEVIHIDSFGNIITNVPRTLFEDFLSGRRFKIIVNAKSIESVSRTYQDVERGRPVALFGSMELLEIAIHSGRADRRIGAGRGDPVQILAEPS